MSERFDFIVAGAGLGGLSAATMLARQGHRVLLLERHNIPGGYATSFVRGRYEFEVALHELSGIVPGRTSGFGDYLADLGVSSRLKFLSVPHLYRSVFPGLDLRLPAGEEAYVETLCRQFPAESEGIRRFVGRVVTLQGEVEAMEERFSRSGLTLGLLAQVPLRYPRALRYLAATWGQVLARDIADPLARAVISQYWGYFGLPPDQVSFFYFAIALASYLRYGASYPVGRSQALANAFVSAFEGWGGTARFRCPVSRVLLEQGRVAGVVTEDGSNYRCRALISNIDPLTLCHELIGVDSVPRAFWKRLRKSRIGPSSVNVYIGAGRTAAELGMSDHEVFVNSSLDMNEHHVAMKAVGPPGAMAVTCYNNVYPEISPPGTSITVLTALAYGEPWLSVTPGSYWETKMQIARQMLNMAERVMPGLRDAAEEIEVSTPLTNIRYAGNVHGSIYGFEQPPWDHTVVRLSAAGPAEGIFLTGAWTQPGGGFQPTIMSGRMAGSLAADYLKRKEGSR